MSSTLTITKAISPIPMGLIGLSFILPFIYGWVGKKWYTALSLGWSLSILSSLVNIFSQRHEQIESISNNTIYTLEPSQPNLTVALCAGWILPLCGYFLAKKLVGLKIEN